MQPVISRDCDKGIQMTYVDVIDAIYQNGRNRNRLQLNDVNVYGRISSRVEPTGYFAGLNRVRGEYVEVQIIAIECLTVDYFSYQDIMPIAPKTYMAQGTMLAVCEDNSMLGEFVVVRGRKGVNVRFGERRGDSGQKAQSVNCLQFWKGSTEWMIYPNDITGIDSAPEAIKDFVEAQTGGNQELSYPGAEPGFRLPGAFKRDALVAVSLYPISSRGETGSGGVVGASVAGLGGGVASGSPVALYAARAVPVEAHYGSDDEDDVPKPLVNRERVEDIYEHTETFTEEVQRTEFSRSQFHSNLIEKSETPEYLWRRNAIVMGFHDAFVSRMYDFVPGTRVSNRNVVEDLAEKLETKEEKKSDIVTTLEYDSRAFFEGEQLDCLLDTNKLFAAVLDTVLGTRLVGNGTQRTKEGEEKFNSRLTDFILYSPYEAAVVYGMSVIDADKIYFLLSGLDAEGWFDYEKFTRARDVVIVKSVLEDESAPSSLVPQKDLYTKGVSVTNPVQTAISQSDRPFDGYSLGKVDRLLSGVQRVMQEGTYDQLRVKVAESPVTNAPDFDSIGPWKGARYSELGWLRGGNRTMRVVNRANVEGYIDEQGIAVEVGNEIMSAKYMQMEDFVYRKTHEMGSTPSGVSDNHIAEAIAEYEAEKGFQLEDLQKQGVNIVKSRGGVLSGQAGSGKTTVSEVFVKALQKGLPDYKVMFAAPTGKAARRMKEVLGDLGEVRTLHSLFGIGIGGPEIFNTTGNYRHRPVSQENIVYILDEMAMCTTSLLYQVLTRVSPTSMVFYLGDVKQLPPIGKGMPFRDMMEYMPAVELGVSKRAKEGSGINLNCDKINQKSFSSDFEELEPADDFQLIPRADDDIVDTVLSGVRNNVTKMDPDSIQVATPYATAKKPWSSTNLNPKLQEIFLPDAKAIFTHGGKTFREGARAIHVRRNLNSKKRYYYDADSGVLQQARARGVVNGEVGKLLGIVKASNVTLIDDQDYIDQEEEESNIEFIDDEFDEKNKSKGWYVLFEVDDPDINSKVVVLYKGIDRGAGATEFEGRDLRGQDLSNLELAYALTVHKLQGSQAKMVIIPLAQKDNARFVSRNMVYTAVSRAQETVVLVGSVSGPNSMLNASRRNTDVGKVRSVHSIMSGLKEIRG